MRAAGSERTGAVNLPDALQHSDRLLELGEAGFEIRLPSHESFDLRCLVIDLGLELLDVRAGVVARLHQVLLKFVEVGLECGVHGGEELAASTRLLACLQRGEGGVGGD